MKINTDGPRLPINRLKRPLKQRPPSLPSDNDINAEENSLLSENFEREFVQQGAKKFKEWLKKFELK